MKLKNVGFAKDVKGQSYIFKDNADIYQLYVYLISPLPLYVFIIKLQYVYRSQDRVPERTSKTAVYTAYTKKSLIVYVCLAS
jgi:hypothetical protein